MKDLLLAASAFWLGILTILSPCTIAANTAAFSFLIQSFSDWKRLLRASASYTLGRMAAYILLGYGLVSGFLSIPGVSSGLMVDFNRFLGPLLVIVGVLVLDWIPFTLRLSLRFSTEKLFKPDATHSFLMGMVFALAFCPVAAALFFGALIPLSIESRSSSCSPHFMDWGQASRSWGSFSPSAWEHLPTGTGFLPFPGGKVFSAHLPARRLYW